MSAAACLAHEAGSWVSNVQGQAPGLNRRDSIFMNHEGVLFASNKQIAIFLIDEFWAFV